MGVSKFNPQPIFPSSWLPVSQQEVGPLHPTEPIRRPSIYQHSTFSQSPGQFVPVAPSIPACPGNTSLTDTLKNILFVQEKITLALCLRLKQIEI